jgi:hypothetical protein
VLGLVLSAFSGGAHAAPSKIKTPPKAPPSSSASPAAHEKSDGCKVLEDFSSTPVGHFPVGWKTRYEKNQGEAEKLKLYAIEQEGERKVLHGIYGTHAITILRKVEDWDLAKYPIFEWSWKITKMPNGGDESKLSTNDSAASVYLGWEEAWPMKASFWRFAWSSTLPVKTFISRRLGFEKILIVESGSEKLGQWQNEQVNIADHIAKGSEKKLSSPIALAILSDADSTKSSAEAYYANFRICPARSKAP